MTSTSAEEELTEFLNRPLFCVAIRGFIKCGHCASQIPANRMDEVAHCPRCGKDTPTDVAYWSDAIAGLWMAHVLTGRATTFELDDYTIHSGYPVCASCRSKVPAESVEQAVATAALACPRCGAQLPCRQANDVARGVVPGAVLLVGEADVGTTGDEPVRSAHPVVFSCMQCGATLSVDGSKRMVPCRYCQADNYLPDELWLALHPQPVAHDFYIVARPSDMQRWRVALVGRDRWENARVRMVASMPRLPDGLPDLLARWHDPGLRLAIARRSDTPPDVLTKLVKKDPHAPEALAAVGNPALNDTNTILRFFKAKNLQEGSRCPQDFELEAWRILAANPATPIELFYRVVMTPVPDLEPPPGSCLLRKAPNRSDHNHLRAVVAARPDACLLPLDCLKVMVRAGDHAVHMAFATNRSTTPEVLSLLRRFNSVELQLAIAKHPNADAKTIRRLSLRKDPRVAEAARQHHRYSKPTFWDHFGR